mgnify:CR=1 FL=1
MKILTIIPARGGSKGIKDKNIIDVCGQPLISYSIQQALNLKKHNLIDTVLVSTDCEKIANIAKKYGAEVPFLRPSEISGDKAKSIEFFLHSIDFFEQQNITYDAILLLQPTSPIRSFETLKKSIELFKNYKNKSLISVYKEEYINDLVMYKNVDTKELKPLNSLHNKGVRRQDHGSVFVRNGSIYITSVQYIKSNKLIVSDKPLFIKMNKNESINVDTLDDLKFLRTIMCK